MILCQYFFLDSVCQQAILLRSSLTPFSSYWVIFYSFFIILGHSHPFFIILGRFLPFFHYIGSFFTLFILYWVISYPFFIILGRFLPVLYYIEDFVPSSLYLIDVFHNLLYQNGLFTERSDINRHRFNLLNKFFFLIG